MIRGSELSDLNTIIELKIRMFEEANLRHLLNENAREMIVFTRRHSTGSLEMFM